MYDTNKVGTSNNNYYCNIHLEHMHINKQLDHYKIKKSTVQLLHHHPITASMNLLFTYFI